MDIGGKGMGVWGRKRQRGAGGRKGGVRWRGEKKGEGV